MPVTNSISVNHALYEVFIHYGGAVSVTIKSTAEGMPDKLTTFELSQAEAIPIWMSNPTGTISRWEDLCGLLYQILLDRGDISGTVS